MKARHVYVLAIVLTVASFALRWHYRHEIAVFVSDLGWRDAVAGLPGWAIKPAYGFLAPLHFMGPVFILGCCLVSMIGLMRRSDTGMSVFKALREMALAGGIATALWVATLIVLGQSSNHDYMLHSYYWYPIYGAAALIGAMLAEGIRFSTRLASQGLQLDSRR